ncbi:anti-phage defense-associated sirtuin Dsr1 [Marinobacter nauticus]|uniref:anti-phage defense-associated sirtuin Dsr1 n=1 Tax=Marinobacter nauticus TaxID=2743 RepID=UPI003735B52E
MQFVKNGPDVPERLLQAHAEGRVVFFCGAGISYPAGLPGFRGLVNDLFEELGVIPDDIQSAAIKAGQFDTAISLLELEIVGGRKTVRNALLKILTPDLARKNATSTHEALLTLAKTPDQQTRLVTTNFDRVFEEVINSKSLTVERYEAPLLPVPKNRWDGLVYLHGLIPSTPLASKLDRLVISSGDFGLAYLTERWAARFVGELFRNYIVCFVGYSINDPVLRYMMDALSADKLLGESPPEMFAFGSYSKGKQELAARQWKAKNVTPVLYREHNRHHYLHKTLQGWAETYRDGVRGKQRIVMECAISRPLVSTEQDDFAGRLLWALSDPEGSPAKSFADFEPLPSLDWLDVFSDTRYAHSDLPRFGVTPNKTADGDLSFSLISRPAPYKLSPNMALVDQGGNWSYWDNVMYHIARWLTRHLNDPKLLIWCARQGGSLHQSFVSLLENALNSVGRKTRGDTTEPDAEPDNGKKLSSKMRKLWYLFLTNQISSSSDGFRFYQWKQHFESEGLTEVLRLDLCSLLTPKVNISAPIPSLRSDPQEDNSVKSIQGLVDWKITLATGHTHPVIKELSKNEDWNRALPGLLPDFSKLLHDAMRLKQYLEGADETSDLSYIHQPSIAEHSQNKINRDWTALIDLTRDAWLASAQASPYAARQIAFQWHQIKFPLFKRLLFFAGTHEEILTATESLQFLLSDDGWWLWSIETQRESLRLIVSIAHRLDGDQLKELEESILSGPPRNMFVDDLEDADWQQIVRRNVWLRLSKLRSAGANLSRAAQAKLDQISEEHPGWSLSTDEKDEFPYWLGDGDDFRKFTSVPREAHELLEWLRKNPNSDPWKEDDWQRLCKEDFRRSSSVLLILAKANEWPTDRWREALQAWSDETLVQRAWRSISDALIKAPDDVLKKLSHSVCWWLKQVAEKLEAADHGFFSFASRLIQLDQEDGVDTDEPVMRAINHPVGHIAQALLNYWYRQDLQDDQGLTSDIRSIFTTLCDTANPQYRHARLVLSANLITLFRVDPEWTCHYLIPSFNWEKSTMEARSAWAGFLMSPRLYRPLLNLIKHDFLETAAHYGELGEHRGQYASVLAIAALDPGDTFSTKELAIATRSLPIEGLEEASRTLVRSLQGAGNRRQEYWENRVKPYLRNIWPKTKDQTSPLISENLARICIAAAQAFPEAFHMLRAWLEPIPHSFLVINELSASEICSQNPEEVLNFLHLIMNGNDMWPSSELEDCIEALIRAAPSLQSNRQLEELRRILNRRRSG